MACNTIIVDEGNILANPEVEPFFYKLTGNNDLTILQSPSSGYGQMSIGDRLHDALVNKGWRGKWQLIVLVSISDLKRSQKTSIPNYTERVILQGVVEKMVSGLEGKFEPIRTIVIFYDSRHWETALGKPFHAGERQRYDLDRFGYLAEDDESDIPSFTTSELSWICEPWPDMAWFVSYFDSISKNSGATDLEEKRKTLKKLTNQVCQRVNERADEKIRTLSNLTQEDVNHLLLSLTHLKKAFAHQINTEIDKKVGLSKDTPAVILTKILRDVFSVKPFCESQRLLLIRFIKDSHREYESGLLELSFLLLVLVEYELLKFGSAHENLGWRVTIEIDPDQFGHAMAEYGMRLNDCLQEVEEYSSQLVHHASFVKKVRCPEIKSRSVVLAVEKLKKISLKFEEWQGVLSGKGKEFRQYIQENERIFDDERREIVAKPEIEESVKFHRKSLETKAKELQLQGIEKQKLLRAKPITGFQTVYNWSEKSKVLNENVNRIIETKPSIKSLLFLLAGASVMFLLPFLSLIYKDSGVEGLLTHQSLYSVSFCVVLLVASLFVLWVRKKRCLWKIKSNINNLIVENKIRLQGVSRNNREYLSGICTLSQIQQNLVVVKKALKSMERDEQKMKFFSSELQDHHDLKVCLNHIKKERGGSNNRFNIMQGTQPDITKCSVFFPGIDEHRFKIKKGDAAATEYTSFNVPGLRRISFKHDFLFESV